MEAVAYDTLIVGGGIAGLTVALGILKKRKGARVCLVEKYKRVGGRAVTFKKGDYQWEIGAGRISADHVKLHALIKRYGLHTVPISSEVQFRETGQHLFEENRFEPAIDILLRPLLSLKSEMLGQHTLRELLVKIYGAAETQRWMDRFPYHAEMVTMRADMALREFFHEMRSHEGYTVCKEGLSALAEAMAEEIQALGGVILVQNELCAVGKGWAEFRAGSWKDGAARPVRRIEAERIVLAMEVDALRKLGAPFRSWKIAGHLKMEPLFRIYAVFDESWIAGLKRVVTTSPIRYFIPLGDKTAMVSYTDAKFSRHYMEILDKEGEKGLEKEVMTDLRALFPERDIPAPVFFKPHPWTSGVTYWLPGTYSPEKESYEALHPFPKQFPNLYVCGESFSLRQGWIEGAIEHAELLLALLER
jgi:monoamine oxidase